MKKTVFLLAALYCCSLSFGQSSIHALSINNIDGGAINLASYQDSNILIICIAPISETDINKINEIDSLIAVHGSKIRVIGVMSIEDGYIDSNKTAIKNIYTSRGIPIILTEAMYTRKSSINNQSSFLAWLTTKTLNLRFKVDTKGIGQKFFIDKYGKIFAVLPPEVPFISPIVENYINRKS
jgi:hypothetical protein